MKVAVPWLQHSQRFGHCALSQTVCNRKSEISALVEKKTGLDGNRTLIQGGFCVAGPEIERLIQLLARVPGLGPRSARRAALHLIKKREQLHGAAGGALQTAIDKIVVCGACGNVDTQNPCTVCTDPRRDLSIIVVVEDVADLWALERAGAMNARYHVLGGTLSPLDGIGPRRALHRCAGRARACAEVKEVIVAVNATVEGQTTAHYITDQLHDSTSR